MARRNFTKPVQRAAIARANGFCEGKLADGRRCGAVLTKGKFQIDHINPDALTGEPTLINAQVLCSACHIEKTKCDVANIARAIRRSDADNGVKLPPPRPIKSPGFGKRSGRSVPQLPMPPRLGGVRYAEKQR